MAQESMMQAEAQTKWMLIPPFPPIHHTLIFQKEILAVRLLRQTNVYGKVT